MLSYKKPAIWIILAAVAVCIVVAICFLTNPITGGEPEQTQPSGTQPADTQPADTQPEENEPVRNVPGPVDAWYGISNYADRETGEFQLDAFPDVIFRWNGGKVEAVTGEKATVIVDAPSIHHIGAADLNMDGYPEICITADRSAEEHSCYVIVYDYANGKSHSFSPDDNDTGYYLYTTSGYLMCAKESLERDETEEVGRLMIVGADGNAALTMLVPSQPVQSDANAILLYDKYSPDSTVKGEFRMDDYPDVVLRWNYRPYIHDSSERLVAVKDGEEMIPFPYGSVESVFVSDVTGDGKADLCANVSFRFSGLSGFDAVYVYDCANDLLYALSSDLNAIPVARISYLLRIEDGNLLCDRLDEDGNVLVTGTLAFGDCETGKQMYLKRLVSYDYTIYKFVGEDVARDRVQLTLCSDGTCTLNFGTGGTSGKAMGTYHERDGKLYVFTNDDRTYMFRYEGEDLVFVESGSSDLPENCGLYDGCILKARSVFQ